MPINETGPHGAPAVVHDILYWEQLCTQNRADEIFNIAMKQHKVGWFSRWLINMGLFIGGNSAWKSNAKERQAGMPRVIPENLVDAKCTQEPTTLVSGCTETWFEYRERLLKDAQIKIQKWQTNEELDPDYCKADYSQLNSKDYTKGLSPHWVGSFSQPHPLVKIG